METSVNLKLDPVFCLEEMDRFKPEAAFTMAMRSGDETPHTRLQASM